jgi:hypothetical protein
MPIQNFASLMPVFNYISPTNGRGNTNFGWMLYSFVHLPLFQNFQNYHTKFKESALSDIVLTSELFTAVSLILLMAQN